MFDLIGVGRPSIAISDTSLNFPSDDNIDDVLSIFNDGFIFDIGEI